MDNDNILVMNVVDHDDMISSREIWRYDTFRNTAGVKCKRSTEGENVRWLGTSGSG